MLNDNHTNANDWVRQTVNTLSDTLAQNRTQDDVQTFNQAPQAPYISAEQQLNAGLFSQSTMQNNSAPATTSSQSSIGGGFGHNAFASSLPVNAFTGEPLQSNTMAGDISTLSLDNGDGGGNSFGQSSVGAFNQAPSTFSALAQANSANQTGINMTPTQWGVVNNPAVRNPIRDILKKTGRWPTIEANVKTWQKNKVTNDVQTSQSLLLPPLRIVPVSNYGLNQYAQLTSPNIMTDGNMILTTQDAVFERVFNRTLGEEGGYEDRSNRIDTPTNMGIQQKTLDRFKTVHPDLAQGYPQNVKDLTYNQSKQIARKDYFDKYRIGEIVSESLQETMFDSFFNHSPEAPAYWAQQAINQNTDMHIKEDGIFGSETINALNKLSPEETVKVNNAILDFRLSDYENERKTNRNPNYENYSKGLPDRFLRFQK